MKTNLLSIILTISMASLAMSQESDLESIDSDSDGKVTVKEFKEYAEGRLPGFGQLDAFVEKVDADSDGEISEDEFEGRMGVLQALARAGGSEQNRDEKDEDDKDAKNKKPKLDKDVAEAFEKLKKAISKADFKAASKLMTEKAANEMVMSQLMMAKGMINANMPMQLPGIEEVVEKLEDVFEKYELDDIEMDSSQMFRMEFGGSTKDDDSDEKSKEKSEGSDSKDDAKKKPADTQSKIMKELDKKGDRWEIVGALWNAQKGSPFATNPLTGKIESHEADGDKVYLMVKSAPPEANDDGGGIMVMVKSPPVCLVMEKEKSDWKYSGMDRERTMKAMKKFMDENKNGMMMPQRKRQQEDF